MVEGEPPAQGLVDRVRAWLSEHNFDAELEDAERALLETPVGEADQQSAVNASWRSEGLCVLAWALGALEMPSHDAQINPAETSSKIGFLRVPPSEPRLRSPEQLQRIGEQLFAIHWRLREFSLRPQAVDFVAFSKSNWFCKFDVDPIAVAEKDLAIRGVAIAKAPRDAVRMCQSIAMERHQAINWLLGQHAVYSEVHTST
jgi:hypothetical protein